MGQQFTAFGVRMSALYAASFLALGIHLPYLPLLLSHRGMGATEIALVGALPSVLRIVLVPLLGVLADARRAHVTVLVVLSASAVLAAVLVALLEMPAALGGAACLFALALMAIVPLSDAVAMAGVRAHGIDYGRMRLWGSLSFIAANLAGGLAIAEFGSDAIGWLLVGGSLALLASAAFVRMPGEALASGVVSPRSEAPVGAFATWRGAWRLLSAPRLMLLLIAVGVVQASHAMYYAFSAVHWTALGIGAGAIGLLWAIGVLAEVALFMFAGRLTGRLGGQRLIVLGGIAAAVRWAVMAFDPPLAVLFVLQLLHAGSFAATHLGAMQLLRDSISERFAATAQAVNATLLVGLAMALALLLSGVLYEALAGRGFLVMALLAGGATLAAMFAGTPPTLAAQRASASSES